MFVSDRLIFLQLQKTGCSHIARLLHQIVPDEQKQLVGRRLRKHGRLPASVDPAGRCVLGSIRNPWDWYVSLWAFGCHTTSSPGGGVSRMLTQPWKLLRIRHLLTHPSRAPRKLLAEWRRPVGEWRRVYGNPDDPDLFREWLRLILDPDRSDDLGGGYGDSPASVHAGLLTYRYLQLFCRDPRPLFTEVAASREGLVELERGNSLLDRVIRNERLEEDLIAALLDVGFPLTEGQLELLRGSGRTNESSRRRSASYYYDPESAQLVREREHFIISKYGYSGPEA